jgi:hypothetical protein
MLGVKNRNGSRIKVVMIWSSVSGVQRSIILSSSSDSVQEYFHGNKRLLLVPTHWSHLLRPYEWIMFAFEHAIKKSMKQAFLFPATMQMLFRGDS